MFKKASVAASLAACVFAIGASSADAHISISNGPAFAGARSVLNFSVGHGCEGADTVKVEVVLPPEVTSVRVEPNAALGNGMVTYDDTGAPTSVIWEKDEPLEGDDHYYQLTMRITTPDLPFSRLYFPAFQTCRTTDGEELSTDWAALPGAPLLDGGVEPPPAPGLLILPQRSPGWNKYTIEEDIDDITMFNDAVIVWSGNAAYSSNPNFAELIGDEEDVELLETIEAGSEIWVKY